jgi:hypothetical protein
LIFFGANAQKNALKKGSKETVRRYGNYYSYFQKLVKIRKLLNRIGASLKGDSAKG